MNDKNKVLEEIMEKEIPTKSKSSISLKDKSVDLMEDSEIEGNAELEFNSAKSKEDVVRIWKKYYLKLGHRRIGRIIVGNRNKL